MLPENWATISLFSGEVREYYLSKRFEPPSRGAKISLSAALSFILLSRFPLYIKNRLGVIQNPEPKD
jgi:hypothetical protein